LHIIRIRRLTHRPPRRLPQLIADVRPNTEVRDLYIERAPCTTVTQVVPDLSEHEVNTKQTDVSHRGMSHVEGGWPKDVDPEEAEHVKRYLKKSQKDVDYLKAVSAIGGQVEDLIKQNNAIDIYEEYFSGRIVDHSSEVPYANTVAIFVDPHKEYKRSASYISWYPDGANKLAVAYSIMEFQQTPENMPTSSYIWDVANPSEPDFELTPSFPLTCVNFNEKDPNILGGGQYNGQVAYWDTRKGHAPVETSPIEHSHRDPVYDLAWMQSKTGTECMTCSTDGWVYWWDIRRISEPVEKLQVMDKVSKSVYGAVSMEYEAIAGPTKFLVGTEQGSVISCNRKAKNPQDRIVGTYPGHHGAVNSVERNPFFPKYFLSIGDWTARLWNEDLKTPIMSTKYDGAYINGGCWSETRPGVFFVIKSDGCLDVWDYFYKQNDSVLSVKVSNDSLTSFNLQESGRYISVGAQNGDVTLLNLCEGLAALQQNEKQGIGQMLEREFKREKNLELRAKEAKIKAKKEAAAAAKAAEEAAGSGASDLIKQCEADFFEQTKGDDDDDAAGEVPPPSAAEIAESADADEA
jgi:dynein intermediate chain 2